MPLSECCTDETHEAVKADPERWKAQTFIGIQDGCGGCDYELRNCTCGSTLAKPTKVAVMPDRRSAL